MTHEPPEEIYWLGVSLGDWFQLAESIGIIGTIILAIISIRSQIKTQRVTNYLTLTAYHRDVWKLTLSNPELKDIFRHSFSGDHDEISPEESQFLSFMFLHASAAFELFRDGKIVEIEGLRADVIDVLSSPLPKQYWDKNKKYYNANFVEFVDKSVTRRW